MMSGIILLWFILTALATAFVAADIRSTPESPVLKWAFVLITAYTGPFGAFLYVLGCREPLPGLHSRYVQARWRQVLGSTMHCVAGDGLGILAGAVIANLLRLSPPAHIALEYVLGFGFGWTIFQALFMRDMAGGSFTRSLYLTFVPEFLSMNALMSGMVPVMAILMAHVPAAVSPRHAAFWFVMSIALLVGGIIAYPINWWLVAHHLKHGMLTLGMNRTTTVRRPEPVAGDDAVPGEMEQRMMAGTHAKKPSMGTVVKMAILSIAIFAVGVTVSVVFSGRL